MSKHYTTDGEVVESQGPVYSRTSELRYPLSSVDAGYVNLNCSSFVAALPPLSTAVTVRVSSASAKPAKQRLHNSGESSMHYLSTKKKLKMYNKIGFKKQEVKFLIYISLLRKIQPAISPSRHFQILSLLLANPGNAVRP